MPPGWHIGYFLSTAPTATLAADGCRLVQACCRRCRCRAACTPAPASRSTRRILVGDRLRRETELTDLQVREGGTGTLIVTTADAAHLHAARPRHHRGVRHRLPRGGEAGRQERHPQARRGAGRTCPGGAPSRPVRSTLFRFSALTGNPHRIHYDRPYAMEVEGYPGLVVHGPFTQAVLIDFVRDNNPGRTIRTFSMRARAPLFDTAPFDLVGRPTEGGAACEVWAVTPAGTIAMQASATLG